jgi:hypothetical protein
VLLDGKFTEQTILANAPVSILHQINFPYDLSLPLIYSPKTDTVYFQASNVTIQFIRLGQSSLDSKYYTVNQTALQAATSWNVSGSWLVTSAGQSFYQFTQPTLTLTPFGPETTPNSRFSVKVTAYNPNDSFEQTV